MKKVKDNIAEKFYYYRDCEISLERTEGIWCYYIIDKDGNEFASNFYESNDPQDVMLHILRNIIDDYYEHPENYEY